MQASFRGKRLGLGTWDSGLAGQHAKVGNASPGRPEIRVPFWLRSGGPQSRKMKLPVRKLRTIHTRKTLRWS